MNHDLSNIFSSKANVLEFLKDNVEKSTIENLYYFTINDWNQNQELILDKIKTRFSASKKIIIRSSAIGEDSVTNSFAGTYESILDIPSTSKQKIKNGIEFVKNSYRKNRNLNPNNQILIQSQTLDVVTSGVIFTCTPDTNSPYYVINYEEGGTTTKTTHGLSTNTIKIYRKTKLTKLEKRWKLLLTSIKELEKLCNHQMLDIEFGITDSYELVIFQVRPMTSVNLQTNQNLTKNFSKQFEMNKKKYSRLIKKRKLSEKKMIFSDMSDWNPAEIIGNNPNNLAYSLYDYLITDSVWLKSRKYLGYQNIKPSKLMVRFGNKPYIDIDASFNSLVPQKFSKKLSKKLLDFYILKLRKYPFLHDKVEFQILFTCYDFMLDERLEELKNNNFSASEIFEIKEKLRSFTKDIILNGEKTMNFCQNQLDKMISHRNELVEELENKKISVNDTIILIQQLLDDCMKYGTFSFAIMARLSFIGTILLKSFQEFSKSKFEFDEFLSSISTPLTYIQNDFVDYKNQKLSKEQFLLKYGHLRPGTYDITQPTYSENEKFLSDISFTKKVKTKKIVFENQYISKFLLKEFNIKDDLSIMNFISTSIEERERFKFEFTKNLSYTLDLITLLGENLNFSREQISNLDIFTILNSKSFTRSKMIHEFKQKINSNKELKILNENLILPQIITSKDDFDIIKYHLAKPNYITSKNIKKQILELTSQTKPFKIKNSILLIENADPGFDWIFAKKPAGLITKYGGVASHMAIRCAEIGLPAAIGCGEILFEKLKSSVKIQLDCKNQQIFVLEHKISDDYIEERKILKSLGYIK